MHCKPLFTSICGLPSMETVLSNQLQINNAYKKVSDLFQYLYQIQIAFIQRVFPAPDTLPFIYNIGEFAKLN